MPGNSPVFSFEFFPPKTAEGIDKLHTTIAELASVKPRFFSVTFGAGGSTRDRTSEVVTDIQADLYTSVDLASARVGRTVMRRLALHNRRHRPLGIAQAR